MTQQYINDSTSYLTAEAARAEVARQATELHLLHQVRTAISDSDRPADVVRQVVDSLASHIGFAHVGAYSVRDSELRLVHQVGYAAPAEILSVNIGICGLVARTAEPVFLADTSADSRYLPVLEDVTSEICVPYGSSAGHRGVLNVEGTSERPLTVDDLRVVLEISGMLTIAIERAEMRSRQRITEQRLELALSAGEVGVWIWNVKAASIDWLIGPEHPLAKLLPQQTTIQGLLDLLDAGDVGHCQHSFALAVTTGLLDLEFRLVDPNGIAVWVSIRGQTVRRDIAGDPAEIVGVITDITGRKRLEEERLRLVHLETARINAEESQRVMATTIDRLSDGFVSFDLNGSVLLINAAAAHLLNVDQRTSIGNDMESVFAQVGTEQSRSALFDACKASTPSAFDLLDPTSGRFLDVHVFPAEDGITVHLRDVTDLRTSEYQRQRAETRFRALVQQAFELIVVMDRAGLVTYISPAVETMLGYHPSEFDRISLPKLIHPDDRSRLQSAFIRILRLPDYVLDIEFRVAHKNGGYRWLDMTLTNLIADPAIQGIVANCRDVSDRHASDFSLWLQAEVSAVVGRSLDVDQTIESLNDLLTGSFAQFSMVAVLDDHGELVRQNWAALDTLDLHEQDVDALLTDVRRAVDVNFGGDSVSARYTLVISSVDPDLTDLPGSFQDIAKRVADLGFESVIVAPITLRRSLRGILVVSPKRDEQLSEIDVSMVEDIARRSGLAIDNAELYEHAREAVAVRDRFLSVAAHELRTPITSVTGYTTMLRKELDDRNDPDRLKRYAGRVDEAGKRLASLAEDLLDVSRIRAGQMPLRMGDVPFKVLVASIVQRYVEQADGAGDRLELVAPDTDPRVFGDSDRLQQVITNLIENGLKYSSTADPVTITLSEANGFVSLSVTDRGIGVPARELEQIFEPFGRATNAVERDVPGLGLGLFICRTIIERHGGRITATSGGIDTGLTVRVDLPIAPDASASI